MQPTYPSFIPTKYRQPLNIVLVLALIVAVYLIGKRMKIWDRPKLEGEEVDLNPNSTQPRTGFNPANEASKLADLLSNTMDLGAEDVQAFDTILKYVDNETRLVHNEWRKKYAGGDFWAGVKPTLRQQVNAEVLAWYRTTDIAKKKAVIAKLDRLNL